MNEPMQDLNTSALRKPFTAPSLERLGALVSKTRGPGQGTEDAIIFAPGGDPTDDPS